MYPFKRLMIGLSLKDEDPNTLEYAAMIHCLSLADKAYFVHVPASLDLPEEVRKEFPVLWEPADEAIVHTMQKMVDEHYLVDKASEVASEVAEGSPQDELLHKMQYKDVDLMIIGEHLGRHHTHNLPVKLARKAPCSLLVVPEDSHARIERILVGIDFFRTFRGRAADRCLHGEGRWAERGDLRPCLSCPDRFREVRQIARRIRRHHVQEC